jgi:hypothetical protein
MHIRERLKKSSKHLHKCEVCEVLKPEEEFIAKHGGKFRVCKECKSHINRLSRFHITPDTYQQLLDAQNNKCAICENELLLEKNKSVIDHCHDTNEIRGILCLKCNTGLGNFSDKKTVLEKAVRYLKQPPAKGEVEHVFVRERYQYIRDYYRRKRDEVCD